MVEADYKLNEAQEKVVSELRETIGQINAVISQKIDPKNPDEVVGVLGEAIALMASTSRVMELATGYYDWAKGMATTEAMANSTVMAMKDAMQRRWFEGRLAKYNAMYIKAERTCKDLVNFCDGLRTMVSYEKAQLNNLGG